DIDLTNATKAHKNSKSYFYLCVWYAFVADFTFIGPPPASSHRVSAWSRTRLFSSRRNRKACPEFRIFPPWRRSTKLSSREDRHNLGPSPSDPPMTPSVRSSPARHRRRE